MEGRHRYAVVWTTSKGHLQHRLDLDDDEFTDALQDEFGDRAGRFGHPTPRKSYPLKRVVVDRPLDGRVLVLGNAAHTVHPVAGQGFNLGLRDVAALAEAIFHSDRNSLGAPAMLDAYARSRTRDVRMVNMFTHSLIRIFSNEYPVLSLAVSYTHLTLPTKRIV